MSEVYFVHEEGEGPHYTGTERGIREAAVTRTRKIKKKKQCSGTPPPLTTRWQNTTHSWEKKKQKQNEDGGTTAGTSQALVRRRPTKVAAYLPLLPGPITSLTEVSALADPSEARTRWSVGAVLEVAGESGASRSDSPRNQDCYKDPGRRPAQCLLAL
ncbi:hypothetical protein NDU88_002268 [Pleurodeles waltl]|uniref:Uncharacterized protein n=1 Tax=Pleurodeles waltl TaxID=8319 RepID=A0AAV7TMS0_PLEWA|nr:hypothetical protein NDU88_002268 [Pleurodeles waltl]